MKTFSKCLALVLAAAGAATLAGCNNGPSNHRTATTANWNVRTSSSVEENSFEFWQTNKEVAEYAISFTQGSNSTYGVTYSESTAMYSTEFYMLAAYDWKSDTIEEYQSAESDTEPVYVYKTSLIITGDYQLKPNGATKHFTDTLDTVCYFRPAGKNLQPVYSEQKVKNTSPATLSASNINSAVVQVDEEYRTYYNKQCSQATVQKYLPESEGSANYVLNSTKKIGLGSDYSNFDNSQIRAAIRAFTLSGGATRTFNILSPQNGGVQSVSARVSNPVELDSTNDKKIIDALDAAPDNYIFFDGTVENKKEDEKDRNYRFNAVSLSINASLQGSSPTMWYSTVENNDINGTRCVLLKMSTPLAFGLGTLHYNLKSLTVVPVQ